MVSFNENRDFFPLRREDKPFGIRNARERVYPQPHKAVWKYSITLIKTQRINERMYEKEKRENLRKAKASLRYADCHNLDDVFIRGRTRSRAKSDSLRATSIRLLELIPTGIRLIPEDYVTPQCLSAGGLSGKLGKRARLDLIPRGFSRRFLSIRV